MKISTARFLTTITVLVLFLSLLHLPAGAQDREKLTGLTGDWRFTLGDNTKFSKPEYDDSDWEKIYVPATWQDEGFRHYHGYAWYRKTFEVDFNAKDILYLELGRIDDVDEVYINGHFIGRTGGFPPDYYTAYNYHRKYFVPQEHLKKGGKNVIAVRIYDEGGEGGIVSSPIGLYRYSAYSENSLNLFGKWKFHLFDNTEWAKETVNESDWEDIIVPSSWESQGFGEYDGFAWYRKTFRLPENFKTDDLILFLGKIDDMDEVFINGKYVGGTGRIEKKWARDDEHQRYRVYSVPEGLLKVGKDNVIAVRVYDQIGAGGIYEGPISLLPRSEYKQYWKRYKEENFDLQHWLSYFLD